jgi:hypothetical protein
MFSPRSIRRKNEPNLRSFLSRTSLLLLILGLLALVRGNNCKLDDGINNIIRKEAKKYPVPTLNMEEFLQGLDDGLSYPYNTFAPKETKWPISELDSMRTLFQRVALVLVDYPDARSWLSKLMCYRYVEGNNEERDNKTAQLVKFFKQTDNELPGGFFIFANSRDYGSTSSEANFPFLEELLAHIEKQGNLVEYFLDNSARSLLNPIREYLSDAFSREDAVGFMETISNSFPTIHNLIKNALCSNSEEIHANFPGFLTALEKDLDANRFECFNAAFRFFPEHRNWSFSVIFFEFFEEWLYQSFFFKDKKEFHFVEATLQNLLKLDFESVELRMHDTLDLLLSGKKWQVLRNEQFLGSIPEYIRKSYRRNYVKELLCLVKQRNNGEEGSSTQAERMLDACRDDGILKELVSLSDKEWRNLYLQALFAGNLPSLQEYFPDEIAKEMRLQEEPELERYHKLTQPQNEAGAPKEARFLPTPITEELKSFIKDIIDEKFAETMTAMQRGR